MLSAANLHRACRHYWPAAAVLAGGLVLTGLIRLELLREARVIDEKRFAMRIAEVVDQLDGRVEKTELMMQQLQDTLSFASGDRKQLFREWQSGRGLAYNFPWVCGLLLATNTHPAPWVGQVTLPAGVQSPHWPAFVEFARQLHPECQVAYRTSTRRGMRYVDDYDLRAVRLYLGTNTSSQQITPPSNPPHSSTAAAAESSRTESAHAGNTATDTDATTTNKPPLNAFSKAAWSRGVRVTRHRTIMLDRHGLPVTGALFLLAVQNPKAMDVMRYVRSGNEVYARSVNWTHLDSMIVAPVDFRSMERAMWNGKEADLGVEIFSSFTDRTTESWLNPTGPLPKALDPTFLKSAYLTSSEKWPMYSDRYGLFFYTTPLFEAQSPVRLARTATTAGLALSVLASLLVAIITRARLRQERMTAEIIEARDALAATQRERERLGHDLHDGAIQSLYAVQLGLSRTAETVAARLPESAVVLHDTRKRVDEVIAELRQFILAGPESATPHAMPQLDQVLSSIVRWLKPTTTARLTFEADPDAARHINPSQALALIQIARTALGNAVRHAQAHRISVRLIEHPDAAELVVQDDGIGFDPARPAAPGAGGMGLHTMRSRSNDVGARFTIESRPGHGTRVSVWLPTRRANPPPEMSPKK